MEKTFQPAQFEEQLYGDWERRGLFTARVNTKKKSFSIILPPPNTNGSLHWGHALFVYEDIMIRYYKLQGFETLWQLGLDHAGIETQFVFEKELKKQGKSRHDFDRETLYQMIWDFVEKSKGTIKGQMRRLGFALDWSREKYTLEPEIVRIVYTTFKKLFDDKLVYRAYRLVNYCTSCGTSYSDLEVNYIEKTDAFYYMKYGPFAIGTVRPETKFRDTALAVHPKDRRYKKYIGQTLEIMGLLGPIKMTVIPDEEVDPEFGTGIMKVTPAHDMHDFELGKNHNLPMRPIIDFKGRMDFSWFLEKKDADPKYIERAKKYHGKTIRQMRELMLEDLKEDGLLEKYEPEYVHRVATCYRCGRTLEPLPLEQWFISVRPLADQAKKLVDSKKIKVVPNRFGRQLDMILDNFIDWNISRQNVWGMRIPAYKCASTGQWFASVDAPHKCEICGNNDFEQDPDTFDTWFSSSQWPFSTLQVQGNDMFEYFYPTSVMETGYDILRAWVSRMIMIGYYVTGTVPFKTIYLHGMVRDRHGAKMSKSKGNVMDPLPLVDKYGADAFRSALIFEVKEGADVSLSEDRIRGMRNFANKIWNIGRFLEMNKPKDKQKDTDLTADSLKLKAEFETLKKEYHKHMKAYKFSQAFGQVYEFVWHRFADYYVETLKQELKDGNISTYKALEGVYLESLKLLHPFTPFVTDAVYKQFTDKYILETS